MESIKEHLHIDSFNPDIIVLSDIYQDFKFNAGEGYENFNTFLMCESEEYALNGDGVTYLVYNVIESDDQPHREIVAYYSLSANAIPYLDRIRLDEDEAEKTGQEFDEETWGIPALEIKMFAVDEKYQDVFFTYEGEELPVAAWVMRNIIYEAYRLMTTVVGFKAIFLHAIPSAEDFYLKNGFRPIEKNMRPLECLDSDYKAMYLPLQNIHMNYDD